MEEFDFAAVEPVNKGWSGDKKYRVIRRSGEVCLLRVSDAGKYEEKKREYEIIRRFASLRFPMSQPLGLGLCAEGVWMLLSWLEGEDLEGVLPALPEAEQYRLGREAGAILRRIHSLPLDPADRPAGTKREKKLLQLERYERCPDRVAGDEDAVRFVREGISRIWREPPVYLHGDFHPGNLIYQPDGSIGVIDFNRWEVGDPWEEFYKLQSFGREVSVPYCVGQLDAYFGGPAPEDFWQVLAVYAAHASLFSICWAEPFGPEEVAGMTRRCRLAMEDFDGFRRTVPHWYEDSRGRPWRQG